jgi:RNA polymerase sigma factor (TIGR02999 family)
VAAVTELLPKALSGDRQSQDELFRLVEPELRQLAWHWLLRLTAQERVQVSDVLDRVFLKLMNIQSPDWEHRGQFYSYACRNMPGVLIDLLRAQDRDRRAKEDGDQNAIVKGAAASVRGPSEASLISLRQALSDLERDLSPEHRRVIELKFMGEFTLDEIADLTSIHRSSVDRMIKVSRLYLRDALKSSFPDFGRVSGDSEQASD